MLLLFFAVWIIFNGRITLEIAVFGVAVAALVFAFMCKFMDYSMEKERAFYRKLPLFCIGLCATLVYLLIFALL